MQERRRTERIRVSDHLTGQIGAVGNARIIDISTTGALVEIASHMAPMVGCHFSLPIDGETEIHLDAKVQRCKAAGVSDDGSGRSSVSYRAALEFKDIDESTRTKLERFLQRLKQQSEAPDTARITQLADSVH